MAKTWDKGDIIILGVEPINKMLTFTTDAKLSSKIIISELSFATSVPWMPIERPISAYKTK